MTKHSENLQTITYFDREAEGKLVQFELNYHSERNKFYMNIHDEKNFTSVELSKEEMKIILCGLGEALSK